MPRLATIVKLKNFIVLSLLASLAACGARGLIVDYHDPEMDFAALRTVAVMPFDNLTSNRDAAERVRTTFANSLLATGAVYVLPLGEVARGVARAGIADPTVPSIEEIGRLAGIIKVDAVFTGVVKEYGEVRSGTAAANVIAVSMIMIEIQTGKIVWTASASEGGINIWDRLFGSGGKPMNDVTTAAVGDLINALFK